MDRNINIPVREVKGKLLELVRFNKPQFESYVLDELATEKGFIMLRLPPYHCELNSVKLMWAQVKGYIAANNTIVTLENLKRSTREALELITPEKWRSCVDHVVNKIESSMWELDELIDEVLKSVEPIEIDLNATDSSDEDF